MLRSSKLVLNVCRKNSKRNEISPRHGRISGAFCEINDGIKNVEINEIRPVITNLPCNFKSDLVSADSDWIAACREDTKKNLYEETNIDDSSKTNIATVSNFDENDNFYCFPVACSPIKSLNSGTGSNF